MTMENWITAVKVVVWPVTALAVAWILIRESRRNMEKAILSYMKEQNGMEVRSLTLASIFGQGGYSTLRRLADKGILIRREKEPMPERGGRPDVTYQLPL